MKWKSEKTELERLINIEHVSYEEIGRKYNVSGVAIKKAAKRLGINIPIRRAINPKETFRRGTAKKGICLNCGKEIILYESTNGKFCSAKCQNDFAHKKYLTEWKNGNIDGTTCGGYGVSKHIRRYLFEKFNNSCQLCGWSEVNKYTGSIPLQIHHIDGNCTNNKEENLQLLCPNCHSLTENFGSKNKNATKGRCKYFGKDKRK